MARTPLSAVDSAWLRMEEPANLMMVTGVLHFARRVDPRRLRAVVEERLLAYPRFRRRIAEPPLGIGLPMWVSSSHFDPVAHLHHVALPAPGGKKELETLVSDLMSTPLDFTKPLWQIHLIDYGRGSVMVSRIHHCIADGIALITVLLSLTDTEANPPPRAGHDVALDGGFGGLGDLFKAGNSLVRAGAGLALSPGRTRDLAGKGASAAGALAEVTMLSSDPKTVLKGRLGVAKRAAWSEPIDLDAVKAAGRHVGATVNDVLVSAVAGGLRRYLRLRGEDVDGLEIRATVPVNLRPLSEAHKLGNQFGVVLLPLPIGVSNARRRVAEVKRRMDELKASAQPVVAFGLFSALGLTPQAVQSRALMFFGSKASLVLTNVPGPRQRLYLAGRRLEQAMFWVPQSGHLGLGVSILSYAGEVLIGVASDAGLVPDPERIVASVEKELGSLLGSGAKTR